MRRRARSPASFSSPEIIASIPARSLDRGAPPALRTEVDLSAVLGAMCAHAVEGLLEPYKREVIGILLGRIDRAGALRCTRAVRYETRNRSRTRIDPHPESLRRRGRALARVSGLRFLGCYHSHPEEARSRAHALSREDREIFLEEPTSRVEVVVSTALAGRTARVPAANPRLNRDGSLSYRANGCCYRLTAETKTPRCER
jgi:proteasome lid subunit RPN8/RPN11